MLKIYEDELKELKEKMEKAEKFAEKIPLFKDEILKNKYTGYEDNINFGSSYGSSYRDIYLSWGIKRLHYVWNSDRIISNYDKNDKYDKYLFDIYINQHNLFGNSYDELHESLEKIQNKCTVFFYDEWNSEFYIEDEHIEEFLDTLNEWYLESNSKVKEYEKQKRINKLKEQLAELENE